jgi:hypothetical protein
MSESELCEDDGDDASDDDDDDEEERVESGTASVSDGAAVRRVVVSFSRQGRERRFWRAYIA